MAYFNHAFTKMFLGTGATRTPVAPGPLDPASTNGFITTSGTKSVTLSTLAPGYFMFVDPKTWTRVDAPSNCCPLVLVGSSLLSNDKIGPFHGGYKETNKSKTINPKYVHKWYRVDTCTPQQSVVSIGNTPVTGSGVVTWGTLVAGAGYTPSTTYIVGVTGGTGTAAKYTITVNGGGNVTSAVLYSGGTGYTPGDVLTLAGGTATVTVVTVSPATSLNPNNFTSGNDATCCFQFLCGETYYLRIDVKGSPALRFLNHNAYQNIYAYTGCCTGPTPTPVDSTLVMIAWANMIVENQYITPFIFPVVYDETGNAWFPPNSTVDPAGNPILPSQWWSAYVSTGHIAGQCAGLRLFGAYVETKFGNCTFQVTDFFEKEPVKILASMVDLNGDPCVFEGICVYQECRGLQGMGFGEQVLRDLILSESYLQNYVRSNDFRVREITQGYDIINSVNRNALYTRYFLLHTVPRYNNPTGVFDNDQYMLEIITNTPNGALETYVNNWLGTCPDCVTFEIEDCTPCNVAPI